LQSVVTRDRFLNRFQNLTQPNQARNFWRLLGRKNIRRSKRYEKRYVGQNVMKKTYIGQNVMKKTYVCQNFMKKNSSKMLKSEGVNYLRQVPDF
jgi:hypothetical protein